MTIQPPSAERPRHAPPDVRLVKYDEYIDAHVRTTRRMVKAVDVATVLAVTALGLLTFLLAAAVVEHWLVPAGFSPLARALLFTLLVASSGYYLARRLWPLCVRPINPAYAAQTIEQASPSLKNSLLNLLLFRRRREEISEAVYETLEQQAAERLLRVPVDAAVDRTHLIRLGYVLVAVVAIVALYKIFSPKDPLVTAERVLMPWADLVPASRVSISNVEPGATTLTLGEVLDVSAEVRGIGDDDAVVVRYTTSDGQAVDRPIQMRPAGDEMKFVGRIPDAPGRSAGEPVGVAQDLRYRIEAGDARSLDYAVTVVAAPTITVDRVDYDYPDYTGFADRSVEGIGEIRGLEGTRVTIHARANGPIDEAAIDFEADGRRDVGMQAEDAAATGAFVLALRDDGQRPRFTSYALRYTGTDGRTNREPVKHAIDVLRDYPPEVAILAPQERTRDVRLDETVSIEVEARDPDFALGGVRIRAEVAGRQILDRPLLDGEHGGRFAERFRFTPRDYDLQAGDVVRYWAVASDNRQPDPGTADSETKSLRIVSPDPRQPPPDRVAQRDQPPGREAEPSAGREQQRGDESPTGGEPAAAGGDQSQDQRQQQQPGGIPGGGGNGDAPDKPDASQQPGDGESASAGGQQQHNGKLQHDGKQQHNGDRPKSGEFSREAKPSANPRDGQGESPQNGQRSDRSEDASDRQQPAPVSSEGDNDGEAFDRIRKFLDREGQLNQPNTKPDGADHRPGEEAKPADSPNDSPSPRGQNTSSNGPSGAGDQPQQDQGSPNSQPNVKPADKWQQTPSGEKEMDDQEPPAGGRGKRESDSQGNQGGDRAGGGEEGGGQQANREGTGSAGQNQSADEGGGESSEQGSGNTSPDAGRDATASDRTGESGSGESGQGSRQRDGQGDQPGGKTGVGDDPAPSDADKPFRPDADRQPGGKGRTGVGDDPARSDGDPPDAGTPGGQPGAPTGAGPPRATDSTAPEGDPANLEYARRQTDLVLETLDEQLRRKKLDSRLLDELGWSERELERFLQRWQQLKTAAEADTPQGNAARRELDDALRSLGLRRGPLQQREFEQDQLRDLREGYRAAVPLEFQERLRAYSEGVSRARRDSE